MGVLSKHNRFREMGEVANVYNVEMYGEPVRSLFTSTKFFSLKRHIDITDSMGNMVYYSERKVFSIRDKTEIWDHTGAHIAHIERKFWTLHQRHYINMEDGLNFELSTELWHLVKDIMNLEGLGWQLRGNIWGLNFALFDQNEQVIAVISQKLISLHDKYCVDMYQPQYEQIVVAILITLQHMMYDRAAASSAHSGSTSSN